MRSQSATTGVNARGTYEDLQEYDQKLKPSPLVPRKKLMKKESAMNEAFMRGFFDELEKSGAIGALLGRGAAALKGAGGVKGLAGKGAKWFKGADPFTQMQVAQGGMEAVKGVGGAAVRGVKRLAGGGPGAAQDRAARQGQLGVAAKKPTGLGGGLGMSGAV
jgi:hypothetical protein